VSVYRVTEVIFQAPSPLECAPLQALTAHRIGHGVYPDSPALGDQVGVDARRAVGASRGLQQLTHTLIDLRPTPLPRRRAAVQPFVKPRNAS
jgi:hypothetical protein